MNGKQHAVAAQLLVGLIDDEGHAHLARLVKISHQKIAADVQIAVVFFVEAGRFLDVVVHRVFWN